MSIGSFCKCDVVTATRDTSLQEAAKLMKQNNVGDVIVVENTDGKNKPIGILTDRNIAVEVVADNKNYQELSVGDVMSEELLILHSDQDIKEVLDLMSEKGVRRAPVVDDSGKAIGIATLDNLLILLAEETYSLAKLVRKQINDKPERQAH